MKLTHTLSVVCFALLGISSAQQTANETDPEATDAAAALPVPRCAQLCFAQVLPQYDVALDDINGICPNQNLTTDVSACLYSNCTIPDQLLAERFSKDTCGAASRIRSRTVRVVTWTFFGVAVVFVAARFVARPERFKGSGYGTDDWTILACLALLLPFCAIIQAMTDNGLGADNYTLSADEITTMLKEFYVFEILYTCLVMLTKVSILQLYLRIWTEEAVSRWFRRTCWVFIVIHLLTLLGFAFSFVAQCSPVSYTWTQWDGLHEGHCVQQAAQIYVLGAINIAYDVFVFVLPLHNFLKLNISWRRKTGVCLIFMAGLVVTICSIVRLQYLVKIGLSSNPTWEYSWSIIWSAIECNLSIVCTCMPAMAGLLQRLYASLSGKPLSATSTESKAPTHPAIIDPENPVGVDEMLRMRQADDFDANTEWNESEASAPTEKLERGCWKNTSEGGIELRHEPPRAREVTATKMSYRDGEGRLHEVKVIDKPTDDVVVPRGGGGGRFPGASEEQQSALRELRESRELEWRVQESDWESSQSSPSLRR
ncbi:hypothetical protein CLAFUW4_14361 [Fulvia fulva]|uniref:Extracellular membrane protein CFEM domain-containing protein n=1 Tax=Passalora fulva TaxID=5499 RepID=A0A9Q8PMG0_PASFU|nr:uncharacterized protein CLAFUR5_14192 [Fulvia fulva]KAK4608995.1 hypothetical protein CLAFUR4_14359 [Fulvia fulva]UJO25069.1 hypothetical protein CLAFUR5_14192 [Fulvia fulva]WPV22862.1 hypothetical protein CLAFUW4_14361 [Fulvia fulva]WPV37793.1 hypothetical protein CLAFUW7_14367 [Fulvia fulva]